jgi:hypothetical protein
MTQANRLNCLPKFTARALLSNFSLGNKPPTSNQEIKKSDTSRGVDQSEAYMEEPKKVGISFEEYAKNKRATDEKKKAIEVTVLKDQIKDESVPFKADSSERDFHRKMTLDIAQFKLNRPQDYYSSNLGERPHGILDFSDITLIEKPTRLIVEAILENGFKIGGVDFEGPIILFPQ